MGRFGHNDMDIMARARAASQKVHRSSGNLRFRADFAAFFYCARRIVVHTQCTKIGSHRISQRDLCVSALLKIPNEHVHTNLSSFFRVLLLHHVRFVLPLCLRACWCGRPVDFFGHCAQRRVCVLLTFLVTVRSGGCVGSEEFALESAAARICR